MSIWKTSLAPLSIALCLATVALSQDTALDPQSSVKIDLPADSPLILLSTSMGESRATNRGGAMILDLHMALTLKNAGFKRVRGITLLITSQEFAPGGKGSVARPSIDVAPGQSFTVPVDLRLVRPVQQNGGPLVRVSLDGVLFDDLAFYGPNKLNSQRTMTFWEMEARRDRKYFKQVLSAKGDKGLRDEMLVAITRLADRPRIDVTLARNGRAVGAQVSAQAGAADHLQQFAFLEMPGAPVEPVRGWAEIIGNEARSPRVEVLNKSKQTIRYVEIGWMVKDKEGRDFLAGSVPATENALLIGSGQKATLIQDRSLKFSRVGKPVDIQGITGFVRQVEFSTGGVWVPSRADLQTNPILRDMTPSPEEQRLADIYSKKGLAALVADLNRY